MTVGASSRYGNEIATYTITMGEDGSQNALVYLKASTGVWMLTAGVHSPPMGRLMHDVDISEKTTVSAELFAPIVPCIAAAAITAGHDVGPAASGRVAMLATDDDWVFGHALTAAAAAAEIVMVLVMIYAPSSAATLDSD